MKSTAYNLEDEERHLESYLENTTAIDNTDENDNIHNDDDDDANDFIGKRVYCCKTSRSLYCPECCRVLVPKSHWPRHIIQQQRQSKNNDAGRRRRRPGSSFPFQSMDIVLGVKERRTSSTGIQMMCISKMIAEAAESSRKKRQNQQQHHREVVENENEAIGSSDSDSDNGDSDDNNENEWWRNIKLYDLNRGDALPQYSTVGNNNNNNNMDSAASEEDGGVYVLFPQEGKSVPISAVANKIKRLIVLDIKWSRSFNVQLFSADHHKIIVSKPSEGGGGKTYNPLSSLNDLPFVHLECPPHKSQYWRWHNRGDGMLSTIEAIYFAAREVYVALQQQRDIGEDEKGDDDGNNDSISRQQRCLEENDDDDESFVDILWLFALQRSIIQQRSVQEGRPVAFSEEAKALARALRKQGSPPKTT